MFSTPLKKLKIFCKSITKAVSIFDLTLFIYVKSIDLIKFREITMKAQKDQSDNLFNVMNKIDQKIANCKKKGILLVGKTKTGKSTCFNWIKGTPLVGQKEGKGRNTYYKLKPETNGRDQARIDGGMASCTLVPNMFDLKDYHIIDTAGYEDKRNYVGTIGVAYSLKAIFQVVKEVKFVIVLPETAAYTSSDGFLISTFKHFLSMFKMNKISEQTKKKIFASTSLLVTKCQQPDEIKNDLRKFLEDLKDPKLNENNQDVSILLTHLLETEKIAFFKMAKNGQSPQHPEVIQKLSQKKWDFINIAETKTAEALQNTIVQLPFDRLFANILQSEKQQLKDIISKRIKSYNEFCEVLRETIANNLITQKINNTNIEHTKFIQRVATFLDRNDHYESQQYIDKNRFKIIQGRPQKLKALKLIIELHEIILGEHFHEFTELENIQSKFLNSMAKFRVRFIKLSNLLMKMYSNSALNALRLYRLEYILLRGIREFQMLYDISPYHFHDADQGINDALQIVFPIRADQILNNYIKSFKLDEIEKISLVINQSPALNTIEKYFTNKTEAAQFQSYFSDYHQKLPQPIIEFYPLMRQIKIVLAKTFFKENNYKLSGKYFFQAFQLQCQYERRIKKLHIQTYQGIVPADITQKFNKKMNNHYVSRVLILNFMKSTLIKTKDFEIAIQIAKANRDPTSACEIYQQLLQSVEFQFQKKKETLSKYAEYCFNHGKWQRSCDLLDKMFHCETCYEKKMEINNKLVQYSRNEAKSKDIFINYLSGFKSIEVENDTIKNLIAKIKDKLI